MKQTMIFLIMVMFFVGCSSSNSWGLMDLKYVDVNGSPKSIKETEYEAIKKFDEVIKQDVQSVTCYELNEQGLIQEMIIYDSDGVMFSSMTNKFENGKHIETKLFHAYYGEETHTLKERTSKSEIWEITMPDGKTAQRYCEIENLKLTTIFKDSDGNIVSKREEIKDKKGNTVEFKEYDENEVARWYKATFNDKSQEIEKKVLSGSGEGIYTCKYDSFDKKGNWTKRINYKNGKIQSLVIREITY